MYVADKKMLMMWLYTHVFVYEEVTYLCTDVCSLYVLLCSYHSQKYKCVYQCNVLFFIYVLQKINVNDKHPRLDAIKKI